MEIKLIEQLGLNDLDVVEALIDDLENAEIGRAHV